MMSIGYGGVSWEREGESVEEGRWQGEGEMGTSIMVSIIKIKFKIKNKPVQLLWNSLLKKETFPSP